MHGRWHAFWLLHHASPIEYRWPLGLAGKSRTTRTRVCVHPWTIIVPKTVPWSTVLAYLSEWLTYAYGPSVSMSSHETTATGTVDVVTAGVTQRRREHQTLSLTSEQTENDADADDDAARTDVPRRLHDDADAALRAACTREVFWQRPLERSSQTLVFSRQPSRRGAGGPCYSLPAPSTLFSYIRISVLESCEFIDNGKWPCPPRPVSSNSRKMTTGHFTRSKLSYFGDIYDCGQ